MRPPTPSGLRQAEINDGRRLAEREPPSSSRNWELKEKNRPVPKTRQREKERRDEKGGCRMATQFQ